MHLAARHRPAAVVGFALVTLCAAVPAQRLVKDIHTILPATNPSSKPRDFVVVGSQLFFVAEETHNSGEELWVSDGTTAGTELVIDLNPSNIAVQGPNLLTAVGDMLFFESSGPGVSTNLWKSDGTKAGTNVVKIIRPVGPTPIAHMVALGDELLFAADDLGGWEWWKSDGTEAGTFKFAPGAATPAFPGPFVWGDKVVYPGFSATEGIELWITDGTQAGTYLVKDINPGVGRASPQEFVVLGNELFFVATDGQSYDLWKTDGTAANTIRVTQNLGNSFDRPMGLTLFNGELYFHIRTFGKRGIYRTDGTAAGTVFVVDVTGFRDALAFNGELFFGNGDALWKTDGTASGTVEALSASATVSGLTATGTEFYFGEWSSSSYADLWRSDGTGAGTFRVGSHRSEEWLAFNGSLYFTEGELYRAAGGVATIVKDIALPQASSYPRGFASLDGVLLFGADDGVAGRELWRSDGTAAGTYMVIDFNPGPGDGISGVYGRWQGEMLFTGLPDAELWKTDGTAAGTQLVADIVPGPTGSGPSSFTRFAGTIFFQAIHPSYGRELWVTDGTAAGTRLFLDAWPGPRSGLRGRLTVVGDLMFFEGESAAHGEELWVTDGTPQGTYMVADIYPGTWNSGVNDLTPFGDVLLFRANDGQNGYELWRSDGTAAGTFMLRDIAPGSSHGSPDALAVMGDRGVVFRAYEPQTGWEVWFTDGTPSGTRLVEDIWPGTQGSTGGFLARNGIALFTALAPNAGSELWRTDGTAQGTWPVAQTWPGPASGGPRTAMAPLGLGSRVVFGATDGVGGIEPWVSDGTGSGTYMVGEIVPGERGSFPRYFFEVGTDLFFAATDAVTGEELYAVSLASLGVPWAEKLGLGCNGALDVVPTLDHVGIPTVGNQGFSLRMRGPPAPYHGVFLLSLAAQQLPMGSGCSLLVAAPLFAIPGRYLDGSYRLRLPIPETPILLGLSVFVQGAYVHTHHSTTHAGMTDGLHLVIGR